ncbi:sensor histidine kinase [Cryptosporangium phraense]|uniref:histidine kinase n=1 Tax=Cryptosporangium phraense TaxID=2593070 RepID=A0A545AVV8_9ACTN|nr:GAF domain-containing sensor histidine kinase [Cryptosporangium phraense]TQS45444.1 GAF domain-containing sensor histidine kinase [Cryptosporangium phraense]
MRSASTRMRFGFAIIAAFLLVAAVLEFAARSAFAGLLSLGGVVLVVLVGLRLTREVAAPLDVLSGVLLRAAAGDRTARAGEGHPVYDATDRLLAAYEHAVAVEEARQVVRRLAEPGGTPTGDLGTTLQDVVRRVGAALDVDRVFLRISEALTEDHRPLVTQWHRDGLTPAPDDLPILPRDPRSTDPAGTADVHPNLRADPILYGDTPRAKAARTLSENADVRALVSLQITAAAQPCGGLLVMDSGGPRNWTAGELDVLSSIAADLSRMMENTKLAADQRRLERDRQMFTATASHELRTPLASMLGYLELLSVGDFGQLTDEQQNAVGVVERNTARLHELVLDLLTISGIGKVGTLADRPPVSLGEVASTVHAETSPLATEAQVELRYDEKAPATVLGDPHLLERALTALVQNAIVFTPAGGTITITLDREDARTIRLVVSDTGIGIPDDELPRVVEPFYRGTNAVELGIAGSGLGLSIVAMIIEQHAGTIGLATNAQGGLDVTIRLPLAQLTASAVSGSIIGWS